MPKRKAEEKIEYYKNKIRKLEKKTRRRIRRVSSTSEDSEQNQSPTPREPEVSITRNLLNESESDVEKETPRNVSTEIPIDPPDGENVSTAPAVPANSADPVVPDLDPNILAALGEVIDDTPEFGEKIHENLAKIWLPLLKKGMTKETREILIKKYLIPENCPLLQAPTLNPEILAAIPESGKTRDKKMSATQQQLGVGITAINRGLQLLISNESTVEAIKFISDGCRILSDLHHQNTETRIKFIIPGLDKSFLQFLDRSERDNTLFGNDLSDKIKASKTITKQGEQIKKSLPPPKASTSSSRPQPIPNRSSYQGNWSGPSRFQSNRGGGRGGHKRSNQRAPPAPSTSKNNLKPRASTRRL